MKHCNLNIRNRSLLNGITLENILILSNRIHLNECIKSDFGMVIELMRPHFLEQNHKTLNAQSLTQLIFKIDHFSNYIETKVGELLHWISFYIFFFVVVVVSFYAH